MKMNNPKAIALAVLLCCSGGIIPAVSASQLGGYEFSYTVSGSQRLRPVQVFDNGDKTYFQFRPGEPVPAIFSQSAVGAEPSMLLPEMEGPYVVVSAIAKSFILKIGYSESSVTYDGASRGPGFQARPMATQNAFGSMPTTGGAQQQYMHQVERVRAVAAAVSTVKPLTFIDPTQPRIAVDLNSYATPVRGDVAQFQPNGVSPVVDAGFSALQADASVDIPFVVGVSNPGPQATRLIKSIATKYKSGYRIEVVGRFDRTYLLDLASKRSTSIVDSLKRYGVDQSSISFKTTESILPEPYNNVSAGATVSIFRNDVQRSVATAAVVTRPSAMMNDLSEKLRQGKISPSQAADMLRRASAQTSVAGGAVQPLAGFQEAQISSWQMKKSDGDIRSVLQRWADEANWHLIWRNAPLIKVNGDATLMRDGFVSAADYLVSQAQVYGYKIKARAYNNKVLVVAAE
jgi:hypothetical protein